MSHALDVYFLAFGQYGGRNPCCLWLREPGPDPNTGPDHSLLALIAALDRCLREEGHEVDLTKSFVPRLVAGEPSVVVTWLRRGRFQMGTLWVAAFVDVGVIENDPIRSVVLHEMVKRGFCSPTGMLPAEHGRLAPRKVRANATRR